jgi:hypothetical protein
MRGLFKRRQRKWLAVSVLGVMSLIAGLVVGINIASGANVPGLGPLDHYLCYSASVPTPATATVAAPAFPLKPKAALLLNQFDHTQGGTGSFQMNCNPVHKTTTDASGTLHTTSINKPNDHLACWSFDGASNHPPQVKIQNQFSPTDAAGNAIPVTLNVGPLKQLCLPSFKTLPGGNLFTGAPDDLDHYSCYQVSYPTAVGGVAPVKFVPPLPPKTPGVQLEDQFTDAQGIVAPGITVAVGTPQLLCLPTIKILQSALTPGQAVPNLDQLIDSTDHLLCFSVRTVAPATFVPPAQVFDSNQFGFGAVNIKGLKLLCVPSLKQVPTPPPTTTTTQPCPPIINCLPTTTTTVPCPPAGTNCTVQPPVVTKVFGATQMPAGGSTSLTFTITNPNATSSLTGLTFNDNLPPPMMVATPGGLVSSCNPAGSVVAPDGAPMINVNGVTLAPGATCSFTVIVTVPAGFTGSGAPLMNVTSPITTNEAALGNPATASIVVG